LIAAGFFVRTEVPRERDERGVRFGLDLVAGLAGRDGDHVHPHRVFRVVAEPQVDVVTDDVGRHVEQLAVARRRLGRLSKNPLVVADPRDERLRLGHVGHAEDRRSGHPALRHARGRPAGVVDDRAAAVDGCDERALRGRHREVALARERAAVDRDGAGDAHRHLHRADHVLDVRPVGVGRVERVLAERVDVGVSSLANEATPGGRSGVGVGVRFEFVEANLALADAVGERRGCGFGHGRGSSRRALMTIGFAGASGAAGYPQNFPTTARRSRRAARGATRRRA